MAALTSLRLAPGLVAACVVAGCASGRTDAPAPVAGSGANYVCENGDRFRLVIGDAGAVLDGLPSGPRRLARDAGGLTPGQTVWTGESLRAEFGLGEGGRQALLHRLQVGDTVRCRAD